MPGVGCCCCRLCGCLQVLRDLLDPANKASKTGTAQKVSGGLEIKEHPSLGIYVKGLQEVAVELPRVVKIIEKEGMQVLVRMDYLMIFLVALFTMELVVAVVFIPMVMVDLVELVVAVMVVTMLSQVKLIQEVLLLDMETVVAVVDTPMEVELDLVES